MSLIRGEASASTDAQPASPVLRWDHLGSLSYDEALSHQEKLRDHRLAGHGDDALLTVEHCPGVLTAGRRADPSELLVDPAVLAGHGVELRSVSRGGAWTWHGPGQLVAYPIVRLSDWGLRVPDFVAALELSMLRLVAWALAKAGCDTEAAGLTLARRPGYPGAWLRRADASFAKMGAVGVHVRQFVTLHGLALNLDPDPWGFDWIQPCGLQDEVTSVRRLISELNGDPAATPEVAEGAEYLAGLLPELMRSVAAEGCPPEHCFTD